MTVTPTSPPVPGPRCRGQSRRCLSPQKRGSGIIRSAAPSVRQTAIIMFDLGRKRPLQRSNLFADETFQALAVPPDPRRRAGELSARSPGLNNPAGSAAAREPAVGRVRGSLIRLPNITAPGGAGVGEGRRRRRREVGFAPDPCVGGSRNDLTGGAFLPLAVGCF